MAKKRAGFFIDLLAFANLSGRNIFRGGIGEVWPTDPYPAGAGAFLRLGLTWQQAICRDVPGTPSFAPFP
jgi:hypothetical protein